MADNGKPTNMFQSQLYFCHACNLHSSQSSKRDWTRCHKCQHWYHNTCVKLTKKVASYLPKWICQKCQEMPGIKFLNSGIGVSSLNKPDVVVHEQVETMNSNLEDGNNELEYILSVLKEVNMLQRIPKGARAQASQSLSNTILSILSDNCMENWETLFIFPFCLRKPSTENNISLTTKVKSQIIEYETWKSSSPRETIESFLLKCFNNPKQFSQKSKYSNDYGRLGKAITKKIGDFDIKGAARLASTSDKVAHITDQVREILVSKHPSKRESNKSIPTSGISAITFEVNAVAKAISSFPCGSAAGPDRLSPVHLKDLIAHSNGYSATFLGHLTSLVNHIILGNIPPQVRPFFFGADMLAIQKQDGGIRPIAIGLTLRRLCSKLCARFGSSSLATYLSPNQVGCGVPLGAEAIVHAIREVVNQNEVTIKIDYKNAFNTVDRNVFLVAIKEKIPEIYNYVLSSYGNHSHLLIRGQKAITSSEGVQQGDPLGPLLFCVSIHPMVNNLKSPFNEWYLDDGTLSGSLEDIMEDLTTLINESHQLGLALNPSKTEVIIGRDVNAERKEIICKKMKEVIGDLVFLKSEETNLLGSPITEDAVLPSLTLKLVELERLTANLQFLDSHDALFLLKNCFAIPKLTYILRSGACFQSKVLLELDRTLRLALEHILNLQLEDRAWDQASLSVKQGGLGIRKPSEVALPAFLASYHGCESLVENMLSNSKKTVHGQLLSRGLAQWPLKDIPEPSLRKSQRAWDEMMCERVSDHLISLAQDPMDRARLLAARTKHANDWLEAIPSPQLGLKLDDNQLRISVGLMLGTPLCHPHTCICGAVVDKWGRHGLACKKNGGRYSRHTEVNDLIKRALQTAKIPALLEPVGLERGDGKRPDGVTLCPWSSGKPAVWDFTCRDTLAPSNVFKTSTTAGAAAAEAEIDKKTKYQHLNSSYHLIPVAVETLGGWGPEGLPFINAIGKLIAKHTGEARSRTFLLQRLSIAVKRGNAASIISCLPTSRGMEEVFFLP